MMARRGRGRERRGQTPKAISIPEPRAVAAPPAQRSTIRVAQANRALADALPSVVRNSTRDRTKLPARRSVTTAPLSAAGSRKPAARKPAPEKAVSRAQLTLDQPRHCKSRPETAKPKGAGSGPSKAFVPWCK